MFEKVLFILVTCSMEPKRAKIFDKVSANLTQINKDFSIFNNMIAFDNNSTINSTIESLKSYPYSYQSSYNIGYWSALNWCFENYKTIFKKEFDFVYIIESDMMHYNFFKLKEATEYLYQNSDVGSVRTQKFSIMFRKFYEKSSILSRFTHDAINPISFPSGEKSWFIKSKHYKYLFKSNIHAKLVGLNRLDNMIDIFTELKNIKRIGEEDFFKLSFKNYKFNGIINGGIFTEKLASRLKNGVPRGSYSSNNINPKINYKATRTDMINTKGFNVNQIK